MPSLKLTPEHWIMAGLAVLMAATRFHHEGGPVSLPDASLAVFFLLGWYSGSLSAVTGFLGLAFFIDYLAIVHGGISGYCVTPAYGFLVPTYGVMWGAGRWAGRAANLNLDGRVWLLSLMILTGATTMAFLISNWSFFFWSGRVNGIGWSDYASGIMDYYPGYLATTLVYSVMVFGLSLFGRFGVSVEAWPTRFK